MQPPHSRCSLRPACRRHGDIGPGHLRHDAVHPEPHLHVVCGPGRQHGLPASGCRHPGHAPLAPQLPHHDPPALRGCPGECRAHAGCFGMGVASGQKDQLGGSHGRVSVLASVGFTMISGEASGSGKDSHWRDRLLLTVPGAGWAGGLPCHVCPRGKHQRHSGGTEQGWGVDRDFTVVSAGRNSEAGPAGLRTG